MKKLTPLLLVLLLMASCQKDPDTSKLSGNFLVYTDYDTSENFKDFDTFYIPDSILLITSSKTPSYWNNEQSQELLTTVIDNMTKYGYNQVMDKEFADVGIQVSYIESTYYFTNYSSPYWWWDYPRDTGIRAIGEDIGTAGTTPIPYRITTRPALFL